MSNQTDVLADINRKHRQKMLLLKTKAESMFNRPSPLSSNPPKSPHLLPHPPPPQFDLTKQYESNKTSQPDHEISSSDRADRSLDYNSTLFRYFKQQSNIAEKPSQFFNNGSAVSSHSGVTRNLEGNQLLRDDGLLSKIDQLLMNRKKSNTSGIKGVYDDYLERKSMTNSSGFSNTSSIVSHDLRLTQPKLKPNTHILLNKLKTIEQEQKATLTIDRQQQHRSKQQKRKNDTPIRSATTKPEFKKPPLARQAAQNLQSTSAIQRQKKKIQQTIQQIKKQQSYEYQDKDTLILEFSDNQSSIEEQDRHEAAANSDRNLKQKYKEKEAKKVELGKQKNLLLRQLSEVEKELEKLQNEEQEEQQF